MRLGLEQALGQAGAMEPRPSCFFLLVLCYRSFWRQFQMII